jgi:hypothetical protein
LRFAVPRPGCPVASPRSRGVPSRDVPGRVHVSVAGETTGSAHEARLALARLPVHPPACRTALAREMRHYLLNPAGSLLLQAAHQQAPTRPHDLAVEPSLLADVQAGIVPRSFGGSGHVADLEIFDPDYVEPPRNVRAGLLRPVLAPVRLAGAQPGDGQLHAPAAVRPMPRPGQFPLQPPKAHALPCGQAGCAQQFTRRQRRGDRHAPVDPHGSAVARCRDRSGDRREGDMPAPGPVHRHPVGLGAWWQRAGPAEPYPPGLRHPHPAHVARHAAHVPMLPAPPHNPESLVTPGLAPGRPTGRVAQVEERRHRIGEVAQRLLLHHLGADGQPRVLRPRLRELPALLQVSRRMLPAWAPVRVLLDGQVPGVPGVSAVVPQHGLLRGRGEQSIPRHANTLATTADISGEVKRRFLRA